MPWNWITSPEQEAEKFHRWVGRLKATVIEAPHTMTVPRDIEMLPCGCTLGTSKGRLKVARFQDGTIRHSCGRVIWPLPPMTDVSQKGEDV